MSAQVCQAVCTKVYAVALWIEGREGNFMIGECLKSIFVPGDKSAWQTKQADKSAQKGINPT